MSELKELLAEDEGYFIQLLFCRSRLLLARENRPLYDALFERYKKIYRDGRKLHQDLSEIADKFIATI